MTKPKPTPEQEVVKITKEGEKLLKELHEAEKIDWRK